MFIFEANINIMVSFLIFFYLFVPAIIIFLTEKNSILNKIGTVIIAYIIGLIFGNCGILPSPSLALKELYLKGGVELTKENIMAFYNKGIINDKDLLYLRIREIQNVISNLAVPLALPLLLFSLNVGKWLKNLKTTILALISGTISVLTVVSVGYFIFKDKINDLWKISGMLIGLYTGGTPNLASLKMMLNVNPEVYILTHTFDTFIGIFYLLFLMSLGKVLFRKFLGQGKNVNSIILNDNYMPMNSYNGILKFHVFSRLVLLFFLSVGIFLLSYGLSLLFTKDFQVLVIILSITTLSIILSIFIKDKYSEKSYEAGMYFILIFSLVVSSMANFKTLFNFSHVSLLLYIVFAVFGSLFLQAILSKLFKIDGDTVIISSTALICSPPFVPVVAESLKNKNMIISGLATGIIGYAIGNYLGVVLGLFLKNLG